MYFFFTSFSWQTFILIYNFFNFFCLGEYYLLNKIIMGKTFYTAKCILTCKYGFFKNILRFYWTPTKSERTYDSLPVRPLVHQFSRNLMKRLCWELTWRFVMHTPRVFVMIFIKAIIFPWYAKKTLKEYFSVIIWKTWH